MGGHDEAPPVSGGVRVFSIGGRMVYQRERLLGMTDEERRWRAQFLKDHVLAADEPRFVPEYYKATHNIFVRMFRMPMDIVEKAVAPIIGPKRAPAFRYVTGKLIAFYLGAMCITYYVKYNTQDWTRYGGWLYRTGRARQLPGEPGYPTVPNKEKYEYADLGFSKSHFW